MARIKFSVFVVVSVVLGVVGLAHLSSRLDSLAQTQTAERLSWGQLLFETSGRLAQSYRTAALTVAAAGPSLLQVAVTQGNAAPAPAVVAAAGSAVHGALEKLPAGIRGASFYLVGTEKGVAVAPMAGGDPTLSDDKNAFGLLAAGQAGPQGTHVVVDGKLFSVAAAPIRILEAGGERTVGWLGAAFPLDDAFAAEQSKDLTMGVTLVAGKVSSSSLAGADRAAAMSAQDGRLALGELPRLGPIGLPLFVDHPAPAQAHAFPLDGVQGARVVITAPSATLSTLADFQRSALLGIGAILAAALTVLILLGSAAAPAKPVEPEQPSKPSVASPPKLVPAGPSSLSTLEAEPPAAPAVTPDDFPFGATKPMQVPNFDSPPEPPPPAPEPTPEPAAETFTAPEPPPALVPEPAAQASAPEPPFDPPAPEPMPRQPTPPPPPPETYSPFAPAPEEPAMADKPFDPFGAAAAMSPPPEQPGSRDATVVAAVPEQLLRATRRPAVVASPAAVPLPAPPAPEPPAAAPAASSEEAHFQEVFNQFVATRHQCNEPADGLTYDKFIGKLRKNKEQLIQKYNCKSVRFQVYVKEGKAALKATPVKD